MTRMNENTLSPSCLDSLTVEDASLSITVNEGELPDFLLAANDAIRRGDLTRARGLLNDDNITVVHESVARGGAGTGVMFVLARLLKDTFLLEKAEYWYKRILEVQPNAQVCFDLHVMYEAMGNRLADQLHYGEEAVRLDPDNACHQLSLARTLIEAGRRQSGMERLRRVIALKPQDRGFRSVYLWYEHYFEQWGRSDFAQAYQAMSHLTTPTPVTYTHYPNTPDPNRRLRVGMVSPNFSRSSVAVTLEPFFDGYDRERMEVFGYGHIRNPDEVTKRFQQKMDCFHNIAFLSDARVAELIHRDRIDVLVAVAGRCRNHRLDMMAAQPAPVQVDWGGLDTSGMTEIRYRISDEVLDPPSLQACYLEETVNLPGGMFCFTPIKEDPPVGPLPALEKGYVTYGSFNNCAKISDTTLCMWTEILQRNPRSRFILKLSRGCGELILDRFAKKGIAPERVEIVGFLPYEQYLRMLAQVDLVLDTFPYNGCITTLKTLWMGALIITLCGDTFVSRMGAAILHQIGLDMFVAQSKQEYVDKACAFADQLDHLNAIRSSLRSLLLHSPLCDCRRYAGELEKAFRGMWQQWCQSLSRE